MLGNGIVLGVGILLLVIVLGMIEWTVRNRHKQVEKDKKARDRTHSMRMGLAQMLQLAPKDLSLAGFTPKTRCY